MPGEPVVVLHVALAEEIPSNIASVVRHHRMRKRFSVETSSSSSASDAGADEDTSLCKAAVFYSISSTQTGLQGIELGTHLIKQAVSCLREEMPNLEHFVTLSPIPGFRYILTIGGRESFMHRKKYVVTIRVHYPGIRFDHAFFFIFQNLVTQLSSSGDKGGRRGALFAAGTEALVVQAAMQFGAGPRRNPRPSEAKSMAGG